MRVWWGIVQRLSIGEQKPRPSSLWWSILVNRTFTDSAARACRLYVVSKLTKYNQRTSIAPHVNWLLSWFHSPYQLSYRPTNPTRKHNNMSAGPMRNYYLAISKCLYLSPFHPPLTRPPRATSHPYAVVRLNVYMIGVLCQFVCFFCALATPCLLMASSYPLPFPHFPYTLFPVTLLAIVSSLPQLCPLFSCSRVFGVLFYELSRARNMEIANGENLIDVHL